MFRALSRIVAILNMGSEKVGGNYDSNYIDTIAYHRLQQFVC